jgi:hypothetical protein
MSLTARNFTGREHSQPQSCALHSVGKYRWPIQASPPEEQLEEDVMELGKVERIERLLACLYQQIRKSMRGAEARGHDLFNFGVGDPHQPTPQHLVDALARRPRLDLTGVMAIPGIGYGGQGDGVRISLGTPGARPEEATGRVDTTLDDLPAYGVLVS